MSNIRTQIGKVVGKTLNSYHSRVKPKIDELKFKEEYQGRIIDCMVGEVDDNYIETPETDSSIVKLEHSKEGLVKVPSIKGKTILVDSEGNETDTPAEGCRLVSVGEEEDNKLIILSKNKNLFDGKFKKGYAIGVDEGHHFGDFYPSENYSSSANYISVEPNVTYRVNKDRIWVIEYDKYFKPIKFNEGWTTFVFDLNTKYIRFYLNNANTLNVQIEKNENITSYMTHQSHKTEILLNEPLKQGDLIEGNKHYIKYKKVVFDGSEKWNSFKDNGNTVSAMIGKLQYKKLVDIKSVNTQFKNYSIPYSYNQSDTEHFYMDVNFVLYLSKDRGIISLDSFKEYLSNNNFELIAELTEPIIEELPNSITLQGFDDTTMYIENSIIPTVSYGYNALIPYKEELLNQKEEVETNILDVENNIIPYLMDMEYNLMLMEDE